MDCPKCHVRMQQSEPSPLQAILFCPSCRARIVITLTQGISTIALTLEAEHLLCDWGEFDRVSVPQVFQDAFSEEEVLEP